MNDIVLPDAFQLTEEEKEKLNKYGPELFKALKTRVWWPTPAQLLAVQSNADVLIWGGAAGSGKSNLIAGLALTEHTDSLILRRESTQLGGILDEIQTMLGGDRSGYNTKTGRWITPDNRRIDLGSAPNEGDESKWQGRAHSLLALDEVLHFSQHQFEFLQGWVRTVNPNERCRIIGTCNPPLKASERWIINYLRPWLDPSHHNQAKPGELRWFSRINGVDTELENGLPFEDDQGNVIKPKSRTFIPAKLADNPYLERSGYRATIEAMPEPMRSALLNGDFHALSADGDQQIIPTKWVELAMARWTADGHKNREMTAIGVDVARGGRDASIAAVRHGWWFDHLHEFKDRETATGGVLAQNILQIIGNQQPKVAIDIVGVGAALHDALAPFLSDNLVGIVSQGAPDNKTDSSGILSFVNQRAWLWWNLREKLDPETGINIALPPDNQLLLDLTAPSYSMTARGIQVESKDDLRRRLGRSPDRGDAIVYCAGQRSNKITKHNIITNHKRDRFYRW